MYQGAAVRPLFLARRFVVERISIGYIPPMVSRAQRIVLADHARLPWRFFGRLTAVQAGLFSFGPTPTLSTPVPPFLFEEGPNPANAHALHQHLGRPHWCTKGPPDLC